MDDDKKSNNVCNPTKKKKKKKQNFPISQETINHPDSRLQNNELKINQNSQTKFVTKPDDHERADPKQREYKLKKKLQNNTGPSKQSANNGTNVGDSKNSTPLISKKFSPKKPGVKSMPSKNERFEESSQEQFDIKDIMDDSKAMELIQDLLNCFICNSTLPVNELQILKASFFERICGVFLNILNNSVEKTFIRVLNSDLIQELRKTPVLKKDASCQTSFSDMSESEESSCSSVKCAKLQSPKQT